MDVSKHNERLDFLEDLIDSEELTGLMDLIAEVCSAKADFIRENWQDDLTADTWDGYAAGFLHCGTGPHFLPFTVQVSAENANRISVAKEFVDMHRYQLPAWAPKFQNPSMSDDDAYLTIYAEMMSGSYGEVRKNDVPGGVEYEIEISKHDSVNGLPFLYTW